jgi:hypothetical protein
MKKLIFLLAVCAFCLNCGSKPAANTSAAANKPAENKPAPAATTPPPASPAKSEAPKDTDAAEKPDSKSNPDLDFKLVNKTGYDIKQVLVGASGTGDWAKEDELLKGRAFKNGEMLDIKFNPKETAAKWDMKVEWADGSGGVEWTNLDLTTIEKLTLVYDKETDKTTAVVE